MGQLTGTPAGGGSGQAVRELGCRKRNTRTHTHPLLLQLLFGRTDASLQIKKLWRFLPELCRHPVLHKACASLFFLLGGYNEKNFNMVGWWPCVEEREQQPLGALLGSTQPCPPALPTPRLLPAPSLPDTLPSLLRLLTPSAHGQADTARAARVPLPNPSLAASPPQIGKVLRLCWVNVSGRVEPDSISVLGPPVTGTSCTSHQQPWCVAPAPTHPEAASG